MREVTDDDKRRASLAYSEAVNGQCPDGIHKDECWKCMQAVMARAIAAAREEGRAAGYAEAKADAANAVHADLSLFDEGMDGIATVRDFVHVYKRRVALIIAGLAPATTKEPK